MKSRLSAILAILLTCSVLVAEEESEKYSTLCIPWGTSNWPDLMTAPRLAKPITEMPFYSWSLKNTSKWVSIERHKGSHCFLIKDDSKSLFSFPVELSVCAGGEKENGSKWVICGQVYEWQEKDRGQIVHLKDHTKAVAPKDSRGLFSFHTSLMVRVQEVDRVGNREKIAAIEVDFNEWDKSRRRFFNEGGEDKCTLRLNCVATSGHHHELMSPEPDDGKRFKYLRGAPGEHGVTQFTTLKVDDVIETTYFKFKVHSIVMPDEKEKIRGWINFKLIESKPLAK